MAKLDWIEEDLWKDEVAELLAADCSVDFDC